MGTYYCYPVGHHDSTRSSVMPCRDGYGVLTSASYSSLQNDTSVYQCPRSQGHTLTCTLAFVLAGSHHTTIPADNALSVLFPDSPDLPGSITVRQPSRHPCIYTRIIMPKFCLSNLTGIYLRGCRWIRYQLGHWCSCTLRCGTPGARSPQRKQAAAGTHATHSINPPAVQTQLGYSILLTTQYTD
eukprot:COSAG05_NODE_7210_length_842_cov_1.292059_1_plen_185_part_00